MEITGRFGLHLFPFLVRGSCGGGQMTALGHADDEGARGPHRGRHQRPQWFR